MKNSLRSFLKCLMAATILSLPLTVLIHAAVAQVRFNAPPVGAPGNRESGASRSDSCAMTLNSRGLTALIPLSNVGLTTQASPSFLAYVPANHAERVEFRLFEEDTGNEVYVGQVPLPITAAETDYPYASSIVSISLPQDGSAVSLEPGKNYLWALMLVCDSGNRAEDIVVTGVVQRPDATYWQTLSPDLRQQLATLDTASPQDQLVAYGEAGMWQDLIATLASLENNDPGTYQSVWNQVLNDQGLEAIAPNPIVFIEAKPIEPNLAGLNGR